MIAIFDEECVVVILPSWRVAQVGVDSGGGTVDFQEFVGGLSAFSSKGGREEKLRCTPRAPRSALCLVLTPCVGAVAFKVYDMDRDGFISNGELFLVLKMMVGNNLKVRFLKDGVVCVLNDNPLRTHNSRRLSIRRLWRRTRTAMAS